MKELVKIILEILVSENKELSVEELQERIREKNLPGNRFETAVAIWRLIDSKQAKLTSERKIVANLENIRKLKEVRKNHVV